MGLITKEIDVSPCGRIKYYEALGYTIPRVLQNCKGTKYYAVPRGTTIRVKVSDLPKGSHVNIVCICDGCGKIIEMMYKQYTKCNHNGKIYCLSCAAKEYRSGENHYQWKHNKSDEERVKGRDYHEYDEFIKRVLCRDNFTCQCCGATNCKLNVHHLNGYDWYIEGRIDDTNGISLCENCHKNFHSIYGYGNNTKEQFEEWIGYLLDNFKKYDGVIPPLREVYCFETNQVYQNVFEAAQEFNITDMSVRLCCNRKYRQCKGLHFLWNDEYEHISQQSLNDFWTWVNDDSNYRNKVICLTTNEIFDSISKANQYYNTSNVGKCCNGNEKSAGKLNDGTPLLWMFLSDYENMSEQEINEYKNHCKRKRSSNIRKVICITTGVIFDSITEAEQKYNAKSISDCCSHKRNFAGKLNGIPLHWMYYNDFQNLSQEEQNMILNKTI